MASLTPGIASRRFTCYIASDSVALRLWAKQPGKWYLMGLRVAIPDPSREKTLGRKLLSDEEKRRLKNGEEIDRVVTPVDDLDEATEGEEKLIGRNVKPEVNLRVKFRRALNQKSISWFDRKSKGLKETFLGETEEEKKEFFANQKKDERRWLEAEGRPGLIIEVAEEFPSVS